MPPSIFSEPAVTVESICKVQQRNLPILILLELQRSMNCKEILISGISGKSLFH